MKFYAYIPDKNDNEPLGTEGKLLFELKTINGAIKRCEKYLKVYRLYTYTNFYDDKTFRLLDHKVS